jgi:PST family polysaccharide transporter
LIATMTLAPLVMAVFYSPEFHAAVTVLRWLCLGMLLRIVSWPIGFIVLAKGAQRIFFWTETAAAVVQVGLAWILLKVMGVGLAFFGLYIWHTVLMYVIVRHLTDFRWSAANRRLGVIFLSAAVLIFLAVTFLPFWPATAIGVLATFVAGLYSLMELLKLLPPEWFPAPLRPWLSRLTVGRPAREAD